MKLILFVIVIACAVALGLITLGFGVGVGAHCMKDILTGAVDMNKLDEYGFSENLKYFYKLVNSINNR